MLALLLAALVFQPSLEAPPRQLAQATRPGAESPPPPPRPSPPAPGPRAAGSPVPTPLPPPPPPPGELDPLVGDWPAEPSGKRVTLADTVSLDDALEQIADAAGWNLVLNTGRTGNIQLVLKLRDVPVEEAMRAALRGTRLEASRRRDTVVVSPSTLPVERRPTLAGFGKPSGKRFTGEFEGTDVDDALRQIAAAGGLSIVIPPGVRGQVSGVFNAIAVEDALRAVLDQAGLTAELQGGVVTVRQSPFDGFAGVGEEARRHAQRALRDAERAMRDAEEWRDGPETGSDSRDRVVNGDVTIRSGEVARDVVALRGNVRLEPGAVARDVVAVLGSVKLEGGASAREVTAVMGSVEVGPGAVIEQNATAVGGSVKPDPHAAIGGEQTSVGVPGLGGLAGLFGSSLLFGGGDSALWAIGQALAKFALFFALGLLVVALFPRRVDSVAGAMIASPWRSIFTGLLGIVVTPLLVLLLVVTVIGIPLVAVVALLVLAAGVLGFTALAFHVGRSLPLRVQRGAWVVQLAVGTAIVVLVTEIPLLGALAWVAGALITFGAALRSRFGQQVTVLPTTMAPPPAPAP
ncbi:STN domain-containing protein [Anaeromyxobacter sp. Fw109-5]|uniref:STN domain-containing protein n=1 Tax=Anaeromyxobacter sp. (strain Fw109-5) TaxID=404589 RepID=UPI0000ED8A0E|nr:STN domain-containing protein [Anaeromyxobacter sp. Fw109-5]ABS26327.1 Secretin/TonB short domain [Anaeromyxobacter sp. Fw109-5]